MRRAVSNDPRNPDAPHVALRGASSEDTMNKIWRFYLDDQREWRWQALSVGRDVISESTCAFKAYETCVANAQAEGYLYVPSKVKPHTPKSR